MADQEKDTMTADAAEETVEEAVIEEAVEAATPSLY